MLAIMFKTDSLQCFSNKPAPENLLWRYMDITRFLSLLEDEALYFARADQMSDKWEGATGTYNDLMRSRPEYYGQAGEAVAVALRRHRNAFLEQTFMSCWHENSAESAAMWEIYQREGRGVAICTTWADLTASITADRWVFGGRITYADYRSTFIPEGDSFSPFMYKRKSFEHENEVRLLALPRSPGKSNGTEFQWVKVGSRRPEGTVLPVAVDLRRLINSVYIAPHTAPGSVSWWGKSSKDTGTTSN